jgi:intraflagellar transport protein 46
LFKYIGRYRPEKRRLVSELKPFIPEYIAATGDVDEFLKPPRPDGKFEPLGLRVLDEPSANQSDPAIMRKFLKANLQGTAGVEDVDDNAIEHGDEDRANKIQQWIQNVQDLHDKELAGEVRYGPAFSCAVSTCQHTMTNRLPDH